jgi:hypothetical protein
MSLSFGSGPFGADPGVPPSMATVSVFAKPVNYHDLLPPIVLTVPHAAGAASLVLPTGAGARLGSLPANRIFRVTALKFPGTTAEEVLGIYDATGIDVPGDTLTGLTGAEGFANVALAAGVTIDVRTTARDYEDHSAAINALEATVGAAVNADVGSFTNASITVDARGRVTAAASGTAGGMAIGDPIGGGTAGRVLVTGPGPVLADDDLAWDAADKLLKISDTSSGRTYIGALPGFPAYGGVWIGHAIPDNTNYSLLGTGTSTLFNDVNELSFSVANVVLVNLRTACVAVGYGVTSSTADATTTMHVAAAAPGYKAMVIAGAPGQTADLQEWRVGTGPVLARVNAAGSLKVDGQAGEYPIEVFTADGTTPIFRVVNSSGDVFSGGEYSSGVGFRATAFGAYVGVSAANRITFPSTSPSIVANPLGASTSVFGVQGASGQTAPLLPLMGFSSTGTPRDLGYVDGGFVVATDASYAGYVDLDAVDFVGRRKGLRVASDGTKALVGFFGATPVAKAAAPTTLADVITILRNLGLSS